MGAISTFDISNAIVDEALHIIAEPEALFAWAEHARRGDRFVYATRCVLPAKSAGANAARNLQARGLVNLCQRPVEGRPERNYEAQRTSRPWPGLDAAPRHPSGDYVDLADETSAANALLPVLARSARFGRPCPTDHMLATQANIPVDAVRPALDALRAINAIRIVRVKAPTLRQIVIVESGHATGMVR